MKKTILISLCLFLFAFSNTDTNNKSEQFIDSEIDKYIYANGSKKITAEQVNYLLKLINHKGGYLEKETKQCDKLINSQKRVTVKSLNACMKCINSKKKQN